MRKNKSYLLELEKELRLRRDKGNECVVWSLSEEEKEYLLSLGYNIIVELYGIKTQHFINPKSISGIAKDIHYAHKKGKDTIIRNLKKDQIKVLEKYNIKYYPIKYRVFL